ncbi:hypothetical protein RRF57_006400 [Xylaria bambusicola]|uniref:Uncharacterized protein n=1 Tax=Xylaria bambusicola TaxID=326684 RepID=A0AAN7UEB2_9PEZI
MIISSHLWLLQLDVFCPLNGRQESKAVIKVLDEMKRVAKPIGIVVAREIAAQRFYPGADLENLIKTILQTTGLKNCYGALLPGVFTLIGFGISFKFKTSASGCGREYDEMFAEGTAARAQWITAGVSEASICLMLDPLR